MATRSKGEKTYSVERGFGAEYTPEGADKPVRRYFTRQDAHLVPLIAPGKRRELLAAGLIKEYDAPEDVPAPVVNGPPPADKT